MSEFHYIFLRDDGLVFGISDHPTVEDLDHARVGIVTIFRLADHHHFGREGQWRPAPAGKLVAPAIEDEPPKPFHAPEHF